MWLKSVRIYKKPAIFSQFFKFSKNTFAYNFKTVIATNPGVISCLARHFIKLSPNYCSFGGVHLLEMERLKIFVLQRFTWI